MRIRVGEWRKLDRAQKYIMILIAYGYWLGRHQKRKKPTSAATVVSFTKKSL
ncbi:hypothetical protein H1164_16740 [Thermoactinomyces daqus]|uniref:Uncharacterized protein n=1 Tax=Thermoactinomyces daqus TaxID=1329516 RepID=A0A7W2AIP9_9BACL|nr:hypothetical protein [Thermoactinomyces daqus]MBA4544482.1 hypothetical protein [Thermoactinomyces daqus]